MLYHYNLSMKTKTITNPILKGFNPDPAMIKVDDTYYIATSTFAFFPGVQIYASKNLINWELVDRPLSRVSQLDLKGVEPGGGVQAPDISYKNGKFYLVYTVVYNPTPMCYYVTTDKIGGEWSEPVYINSSGIDQSFFHDDDGKTYVLTNEVVNQMGFEGVFQGNDNRLFQGINIQEFDLSNKKLIGEPVNIFKGTTLDITEAPHIYKKNGFYYLITAEGGTGYEHTATICRSKELFGNYELSPYGPMLTVSERPELKFQKSGHVSIVDEENGTVWVAALATRPHTLGKRDGSPFGRETILLKYRWTEDGWLESVNGENITYETVESDYEGNEVELKNETFDFTKMNKLPLQLWTERQPITNEWANLTDKGLVLKGRNKQTSYFDKSTVNRIWETNNFEFETRLTFKPKHYKESAGISQKYDDDDQMLFFMSRKYDGTKVLVLDQIKGREAIHCDVIEIPEETTNVILRSRVDSKKITFSYSLNGTDFIEVPTTFDISLLFEQNVSSWGYTGTLMGIFADDEYSRTSEATFEYFKYREIN